MHGLARALSIVANAFRGRPEPSPQPGEAGGDGPEDARFAVRLPDAEWRRRLRPEQYAVLRGRGGEPAFSSPLTDEARPGRFRCAGCGQPLFDSAAKYDSGTGWPTFFAPLPGAVARAVDAVLIRSLALTQTEVHCVACGGHLGHVFDDGPDPTGQRYCLNGAALDFQPGAAHLGDRSPDSV